MTDLTKRSLVFRIDDAAWNKFRSRVAANGRQLQDLVLEWIRTYNTEPSPKPDRPKQAAAVSRPNKQAREELETTSGEPEETGELVPLAEAGISFDDVEKFAELLCLNIKGKTPEQAAFFTLDGIAANYEKQRMELSDEEFDQYKEESDDMLTWFNRNKNYGCDEEDEEGGEENEENAS